MTRHLHFDPAGGAAGDMILAALSELLDADDCLTGLPTRLGLENVSIAIGRESRHALACRTVDVRVEGTSPHRALGDVTALIHAADIAPRVQQLALRVFERLANAEAAVHGVPVAQVHFHEVGADDALVDIVGTCLLLDTLGVSQVTAGPLPLARGTIRAAHGTVPLPAPAVLELVKGWPVEWLAEEGERVTPTGAALITALAGAERPPAGRILETGYGAGTRDYADRPNLIRATLLEVGSSGAATTEEVVELVSCVDDATGEQLARAAEILLGAGALDVYYAPLVMKKGRPGWELTVLSRPEAADEHAGLAMRHTGSAGIRRRTTARQVWSRRWVTVDTPFGSVRVKEFEDVDGSTRAAPEYEDCRRLAEASGRTLQEVQETAVWLYRQTKEG